MKRIAISLLICSWLAGYALAVGRKQAVYVGGTIEKLNARKKESKGELDLSDENVLIFKFKDQSVLIPFQSITGLEYQNAARYRTGKVVAAKGVALLGLATPITALFISLPAYIAAKELERNKRERHYLTVFYTDGADKSQAMVLEIGKDIQMETRAVLSARSGKEVKTIVEDSD